MISTESEDLHDALGEGGKDWYGTDRSTVGSVQMSSTGSRTIGSLETDNIGMTAAAIRGSKKKKSGLCEVSKHQLLADDRHFFMPQENSQQLSHRRGACAIL